MLTNPPIFYDLCVSNSISRPSPHLYNFKLRDGSFEALPVRYVALTGEGGGPAVAGVHPRGLLVDVVDEEDAAVGRHLDQSGVSRWSRDLVSTNHNPPAWSSRWADPPC